MKLQIRNYKGKYESFFFYVPARVLDVLRLRDGSRFNITNQQHSSIFVWIKEIQFKKDKDGLVRLYLEYNRDGCRRGQLSIPLSIVKEMGWQKGQALKWKLIKDGFIVWG